jgi:hypothetical protein
MADVDPVVGGPEPAAADAAPPKPEEPPEDPSEVVRHLSAIDSTLEDAARVSETDSSVADSWSVWCV